MQGQGCQDELEANVSQSRVRVWEDNQPALLGDTIHYTENFKTFKTEDRSLLSTSATKSLE